MIILEQFLRVGLELSGVGRFRGGADAEGAAVLDPAPREGVVVAVFGPPVEKPHVVGRELFAAYPPRVFRTVILGGGQSRGHLSDGVVTDIFRKPVRDVGVVAAHGLVGCRACAVCENGAHAFGAEGHTLDRRRCAACGRCAAECPTSALRVCGSDMSIEEIVREVKKDAAFYGEKGGVTLSGGEPFAQSGTLELVKRLKAEGLNVAVETCGYFDVTAALPYVDLFLWDVKDTDARRHERYTGASNEAILAHLYAADAAGARIRLRCILVAGVNTDAAHYGRVAEIAAELRSCEGADVLPYHAFGGSKAESVGMPDNGSASFVPTEEQLNEARRVICG